MPSTTSKVDRSPHLTAPYPTSRHLKQCQASHGDSRRLHDLPQDSSETPPRGPQDRPRPLQDDLPGISLRGRASLLVSPPCSAGLGRSSESLAAALWSSYVRLSTQLNFNSTSSHLNLLISTRLGPNLDSSWAPFWSLLGSQIGLRSTQDHSWHL